MIVLSSIGIMLLIKLKLIFVSFNNTSLTQPYGRVKKYKTALKLKPKGQVVYSLQ